MVTPRLSWHIYLALIIGCTGIGYCALAGSVIREDQENREIIGLGDTGREINPPVENERQLPRVLARRADDDDPKASGAPSSKKLICYYDNEAAIRPGKGQLKANDLDPFLCTHLVYGPLGVNMNGQIVSLLKKVDTDTPRGEGLNMLAKLSDLKRSNPELKILLGVEDTSTKFSPMASSAEKRSNFTKSALKYLTKYNLDGLDLAWKHPNDKRGATDDRENYVKLVKELRAAFKSKPPKVDRNYLLSASLTVIEQKVLEGIDFGALSGGLDFVNLMSYDYNGGWDNETGLHAPLYPSDQHDRNPEDRKLNVEWSVKFILEQEADAAKLMLGITTFGRSFNLDNETLNGINAPLDGPAKPGPYVKSNKLLAYNELCESMTSDPGSWQIVRDDNYKAPYAFKGTQWVGYENEWSAGLKVKFANEFGLGGVAITSLDKDDFLGECASSNKIKYPITAAVKRELGIASDENPPPQTAAEGGKSGATEGGRDEPLPVCGIDGQWYFPAPKCADYYDCTSGKAVLTHCREGLLWKQSKLWCDFPYNVGDECKNKPPEEQS